MKIGIIFFGLPRNTQSTLPSIKQYILNALGDHEIFIESCFSLQTYISNAHSNEAAALDQANYSFFEQYSHQFIEPDALLDKDLFEQVIKFGDKWKDNGRSLKNLLMQLNCIQIAYLRCKKHGCDFYIFVRPDIIIHEAIPIKTFIERYTKERAVLLPSWQWYKGINDRFAIATQSASDTLGLRYYSVLQYCKDYNQPLHSENFLYSLLISDKSLTIRTCTSKMSRVRVDGTLAQESFSVVKRMGGFNRAVYSNIRRLQPNQKLLGLLSIFCYYLCKVLKIRTKI